MRYILIVLMLVFTLPIYSQDITNKLGGNTASETYDITDSNDNILFRVQGIGNVGIGTSNPTHSLTLKNSTNTYMGFQNNTTGDSYNDGLLVGYSLADAAFMWNYENSPLHFGTNDDYSMTITANRDVGIGTTSPNYKLDVDGTINVGATGTALRCLGDAAIFYNDSYYSWGSGGDFNVFWDEVGIGTNSVDYDLEVNGTAGKTGGGSWSNSSDARLKDITGDYESGLAKILKLKPVTYYYKKNNERELPTKEEFIGFVAQDVQKLFPEAVSEGKDGYLDFNMHSINVAVVNAIQELAKENKELKDRIEELESKLR